MLLLYCVPLIDRVEPANNVGIGKEKATAQGAVYWSAGSNGEVSFGVTVVIAPTIASSR
jgi:hypothetical protein